MVEVQEKDVARESEPDPQARTAFDRVDPRILTLFPELVLELGGDPIGLLDRAGIRAVPCQYGDEVIRYGQAVQVVTEAAFNLACPDFGMRLAERQAGAIRTPLLELVENSATLGQAFEHVVSHSFAHSRAAAIWLKTCPWDETVMLGHDILLDGLNDRRQVIEQILLVEHLICRAATGGLARARRVEFRHQPVSAPALYRRYFNCEVRFGQPADAIIYSERALSLPIIASDAAACRRALADIDRVFDEREPPLHMKIRAIVLHWLGTRSCSNVEVAARLGLNPRTMHRRLREQQTSFQRIKDQVREDLLVHYLDQTNLPFAEISERLGFAEQSALTRFCRQWLAASPRERRMRLVRRV